MRGKKRHEEEEKKEDCHYVECHFGGFRCSEQFPSSADPEKVDATFKKGVLTATLKKRPDAMPKEIQGVVAQSLVWSTRRNTATERHHRSR